jgi:catechol 2,3-dioxygenase-like lactoylglutathione lyase family enzyme
VSRLVRLDHVQLAMPAGREADAVGFYAGLLGLAEVPKPPVLAARGGCWFASGDVVVHLGVDPSFTPATKAHPAFVVDDLAALTATLGAAGVAVVPDDALDGVRRGYVADPFGNRIELIDATPVA